MLDASAMSKLIREKKKKARAAEPSLVDTDLQPDMNPIDIHNMSQKGDIEDLVGADKKIDSDDSDPAVQHAMSKEPMSSHVNPKDHHKMAYGGMVEEHADPIPPSKESAEMIQSAGHEMDQRIGEGFQTGTDIEAEEKRRISMRKQRLGSYLDSLGI